MLTRTDVRRCVTEAEVLYEFCWSMISSYKEPSTNRELSETSILLFQPKLSQAISDLSGQYRRAASEKTQLIQRKSKLNARWFSSRMKFLDNQQKIIKQAVLIGRNIGDAFAWIFYRNDRHFIQEHLKEPEQLLIPNGIGGYAELAVVKGMHSYKGLFILYHGITSLLRLGDFSLIDLKSQKVITIGEIKSGIPTDGRLNISLIFPMLNSESTHELGFTKSIQSPKNNAFARPSVVEGFSPSAKDRFKRQLKRMSNSLDALDNKTDMRVTLEMETRVGEFGQFLDGIKNGKSAKKIFKPSMLAIGLHLSSRSLYSRLTKLEHPNLNKALSGIEVLAASLAIPNSNHNALGISSWHYREDGRLEHIPGMTHPAWWPLPEKAMRQIIFQEIVVFTILNPAHLLTRLEENGYSVTLEKKRAWSIEKNIGEHIFKLEGVGRYLDLIQHYMFSEEDIISFLRGLEQEVLSVPSNSAVKIELRIEQHFGSMPN